MYNSFIRFDKIIRVSTEGMEENFILIITVNGQFVNEKSLPEIQLLLPNSFIQVNFENVINLNFIEGLNEDFSIVYMKAVGEEAKPKPIPVSNTFREKLRKRLDNELFV